ncbi:hypothetical protein B5E58_07010 [Tyzzerella sp. An114]|uniref:ATP-binding protein n=1 Tax=Tyzzerella sp. An114 TaxID=1965545 RepID=UPI000B4393D1|nr:ATP-binding protein [Tyzzerella sp. An114]OUQ58367.1 hypothetical protein B5E58_07010 [Tyzzerella sp. An114]HIT72099.1 ATP-binding protein [Candidatus Fimicola cottocaccae]
MAIKSMEKSFKSSLPNVKIAVDEALTFVDSNINNLSREDFFDLKLVLNELIINAVIHGNNQDITKKVSIYIEIQPENIIKTVISDEGKGYNYEELILKDNEEFSLDENGRGISLVAALIDTLTFNDMGNVVKFTKKVRIK